MNYYFVAFVAFISYILYKFYIYPLYLSPISKIPGPPVDSLIFGHYGSFLNKEPGEAFAHIVKQYGGIVRYHGVFNKSYLLISDPKLIQEVLVNHSYDYPKLFLNKSIAKEIFGEGIVLADRDAHKRQRKMMNSSLAFTYVKEMVPTFIQAGHKLKDLWMKQIGNNKEERIKITNLIPKITLDVIGLADKLVVEQKNTPDQGNNSLSLLIKANENLPIVEQLTHNELVSQVMTLLLAGHETTSNALSWALYFLAKHPDTQDRLREELQNIFTDRNHFPTFDEIEQLKYLECVFKETLRIIPPLAEIIRYNSKDEIMNSYVVPKGTPLIIPVYAIHHDSLIWGDDAKDFNPSRWLDPEIKSKISNFNFLTFGAGPRSCLGMKLAHMELKSILSIIIRNFEFKLVEGFTFRMKISGLTRPIPGIDLLVSKVDN
ncbi:cytochrome P450 [Gigaspora rosea]|uniref:Cytochrome P450 n=1 Tax=Gigaspora rosea TaxID=44941 RepID=A0A397UMQ1_9GLOM|nr:cytochrome P450 [Gigaspora rosea]